MRSSMTNLLALLAIAGLAVACAPAVITNYSPISSHTLQVAADKQADVIWMQQIKGGEIIVLRCHNAAEGPLCVRARTP